MTSRLLLLFFAFVQLCQAQSDDTSLAVFKKTEPLLRSLQKKAFHSAKESERIEGNKEFLAVWDQIINNPNILRYPFDSLKDISVLSPHDKKFMLITWNLHKNDGSHFYFGYLLVNNSKRIKKACSRTRQ